MKKKAFVYRVAKPITSKADPDFYTTRARLGRQLFPSDVLIIPNNGNTVETNRKVEFRAAPHMGKRDVIEYLRKVYNVKAIKVNSLNFPGKLKRSVLPRGTRVYRTKAFKKFVVTVDASASLLPEQRLGKAVEAEVVGKKN